jgi:hypothetical protein
MPIVGCCGKEKTVLEATGEISHRACELSLDPIAATARWRGVMSLVQNQKTSWQEPTEPLTQRIRVGRVNQEVVGYEKAAMRAPGVHSETPLPPHPSQIGPVEQLEYETKALLKFSFPLIQY